MRLNNQITIITGGASGFGACMAETFVAEGAKVVIADINAALGEKVASDLRNAGHDVLFCQTDVTKSADMGRLVQAALDRHGRVDVMINNAGISHPNGPMLNVTEETFDRIFQVNVKSIFHSATHCVPVFRRQRKGCFINIGSTAAVRPRPGLCWYNGSKGAVLLITKSMATELAADGIRANAINPAIAETPLLTTFMGASDTQENRARFTASIPLGRLGRPSDVANAAVFLADPASEFVTGVCMEVDGGRCI